MATFILGTYKAQANTNVQIYGDIGRFNDYIIEKFYSSQGYDGRGSGNYIRTG